MAGRATVVDLADDHLDEAAELLAERHRAQRRLEPGLDPVYEDPAVARVEIEGVREAGYTTIATDWRMTTLTSSRTWPRLGFRATFYRLFRGVA